MSVETLSSQPERFTEDTIGDYLACIGKTALLSAETVTELAKQMEAGIYAQHLLEEDTSATLDATYRKELGAIALEGSEARTQLITANTRLAVHIAKRFRGVSRDFTDLVQDANTGLVEAVDRFDYTKGYAFSTYAENWIKKEVYEGINTHARTIRIPKNQRAIHYKAVKIRNEFTNRYGYPPSDEQVVEALDGQVTLERFRTIENNFAKTEVLSLNSTIESESGRLSYIDLMPTDPDTTIQQSLGETSAEFNELRDNLNYLIDTTLSLREAEILRCFLGYYHNTPRTKCDIAKDFGVSGEAIRQTINKALKKLARHPSVAELHIYLEDF